MIGKLNHVAIAAPNLAAAAKLYRELLATPAQVSDPVALPDQGVTTVFVDTGNSKLELMEPLGEDSPIHKFLEKHSAGGIHHLCFEVRDLLAAVKRLTDAGARALGEPSVGAHGVPVVFLHPKDFGGVLIELEEVAGNSG